MKYSVFLFAAAAAANAQGLERRVACARNPCVLALQALALPENALVDDCVAYLQTTITPDVSTIYRTRTVNSVLTNTITRDKFTTTTLSTVSTTTTTKTRTSPWILGVNNPDYRRRDVPLPTPQAGSLDERQAEPEPTTPPYYASACGAAYEDYVEACRCLGVRPRIRTVATPKETVTYTEVSTRNTRNVYETFSSTETITHATTVVATETVQVRGPICSAGLNYFFYALTPGTGVRQAPFNGISPGRPYSDIWKPEVAIKGRTYNSRMYTSKIGAADIPGQLWVGNIGAPWNQCDTVQGTTVPRIYDANMPSTHSDYVAINHEGFFRPVELGTYTFTAHADDIIQIWLGDVAYTAWTGANANFTADVWKNANGPQTWTYTATQGNVYIPLRIVYANAQGCGRFVLKVTNPNGVVILSDSTAMNQYFMHDCYGDYSPGRFPWETTPDPTPSSTTSSTSSTSTTSTTSTASSTTSTTSTSITTSTSSTMTTTSTAASSTTSAAPTVCTRVANPDESLSCDVRGFGTPLYSPDHLGWVATQADCAAFCAYWKTTNYGACRSWMWLPDTKKCMSWTTRGVWNVLVDGQTAGRQYRNNVIEEVGCWDCPAGAPFQIVDPQY